ncbi:hypothetical protein [Herbaspirillum sp. alder98]|uniref:hypothetical protein n=1 Tax=Herbaspirillum sp. alder98 TaxID=2913096 RepID=UPI001CD837CB|nr:hypothetical protein [Herbaspirillum sp. alder98]MCA1325607.1 hypothetical protein [Herbaspirillum sp. alder98]
MVHINNASPSVRDSTAFDSAAQGSPETHEMRDLAMRPAGETPVVHARDRRPPELQAEPAPEPSLALIHLHNDEPEDPHLEVAPSQTMMAELSSPHGGRSPALRQLHQDMREVGVERAEFDSIVATLGGRDVASASAGALLASLNDHVAIASFPFRFRTSTVTTHLLVIKDTVDDEHGKTDLYFLKGYSDRVVGARELLAFDQRRAELAQAEQDQASAAGKGKGKGKQKAAAQAQPMMMETYVCTYLLELSKKSSLFARRSIDESSTIIMPVPLNATPFPRQFAWAAAENYMAEGFGQRPAVDRGDGREKSDFSLGYSDLNGPENRNIIFITEQKYHDRARPMQHRAYGDYPASLNVGGGAIAEVTGFDAHGVEIMGPAGKVAGVKLATLREIIDKFMRDKPRDRTLIVRTEDQYRHQFVYAPQGLQMTLLDQHGEPVKALAPLPGADVSTYGWRGANTGPFGSPAGYANSMLVVSTGEAIPAGPFLKDRHTLKGIATAASHALVDVILNDMNPAVKGTTANAALNSAMRAAVTAATVYGMTSLINTFRDEKTHALFDGAHPFSGSGAGLVDAKTLAGAIAVTVLAQDVVSMAYRFAYKNFVKDTAKGREKFSGQVFNEAMLPFLGELGRLLVNYGIQTKMGLPRGNEKDIASLVGVATLLTAVDFLRGRSGDPANHLLLSATYKTMDFFAADLVFRTLGAVFGADLPALDAGAGEHVHTDLAKNLLEAFVTRMGARGPDKWLLPMVGLAFSAAGLAGANARAGEDQLARENAPNNLVARVRDAINVLSVDGERMIEAGRDKLEDVEGLRRTAVLLKRGVEQMRRAINHLNLDAPQTHAGELAQVRDAARFHDMSEPQQRAHLEAVTRRYHDMIAASDVFAERNPPPLGDTRESAPPDLSLAVSNSSANLPQRIREQIELLMKRFPQAHAENREITYPTAVAPDFIGAALPHTAKPGAPFAKTERMPRDHTTFTDAQVPYVKEIQRALAEAPGMPRRVEDSNALYLQLSHRMIDEGDHSIHAYSLESQLFHYLLRWAQTGQEKYLRLASGVWFKIAAMNHRGNVTGERDKFVTAISVLMVNLMALHGKPAAHLVHRGVVTDAHYIEQSRQEEARARYGDDAVFIGEGAVVAMSEIMSVTSSTQMTATFLQGLGHGAAPIDRSQHMVIRQETALPVPRQTEHIQVESLLMPGTVATIDRIDHNPPPQGNRDVKQKRKTGELMGPAESTEFNLGQVVYASVADTFLAEVRYLQYQQAQAAAHASGEPLGLTLEDGALCCHPDTSQLYRYDAARQQMVFTGGTLNYFHGGPQEPKEHEQARWREPYTSPQSPAQIRIGIQGAILIGHPVVPFLNDMVRNVSHETYRRLGGYYDPASPNHQYKLADDARRTREKQAAQPPIKEIAGWSQQTVFALPEAGRVFVAGKPFPGELMARVLSSALHRAMMILEVDASGALVMQQRTRIDHHDRERSEQVPLVQRHFLKTHDHFDLTYDTQRAPMLGVGPNGYYVVALHEGQYRAVPVNIAGPGLRAGNLMHAFLALATPNPNRNRYTVKGNEIKSATATPSTLRRLMPGVQRDPVAHTATEMFKRLRNFAKSGYDPVDSWLGRTYAELHPGQDVAKS